MQKIIDEYFETLTRKSTHTLRGYRGSITKLVEFFGLESVDQLSCLTERDFVRFYNEKCGKENTLNTHIRNLSAFFNWMAGKYIPNEHAFFNVTLGGNKFDKVPRKKRAILTKEEIEMAIAAGLNLQEKFMVALAFKTALRAFEIANIKLSDISGCEIRITGKGGDEESTYLNTRLCEMLKSYLETDRNTNSEYLFYGVRGVDSQDGALSEGSVNRRIQRCVERAGINKKVTAHTARRTAITRAAIDRNPLAAQILARHKNLKTTMGYVHVGEEVLKEILLDD